MKQLLSAGTGVLKRNATVFAFHPHATVVKSHSRIANLMPVRFHGDCAKVKAAPSDNPHIRALEERFEQLVPQEQASVDAMAVAKEMAKKAKELGMNEAQSAQVQQSTSIAIKSGSPWCCSIKSSTRGDYLRDLLENALTPKEPPQNAR